MATANKAKSGEKIVLVQTGSTFGNKPGMRENLVGLGLGKVRRRSELIDTPSVRGMIEKVKHLIKIEEKK